MTADSFVGRLVWLRGTSPIIMALGLAACSGGENLRSVQEPTDSTPPVDSTPPPDSTPPVDSTPPPVDSTPPPIDSAPPREHVGVAFGPTDVPWDGYSEVFTGALQNGQPDSVLASLEAARSGNARIMISFTGNEQWNRDQNGFSLAKWKQRVDRFRGLNLESYIADGTLIGHFLLDEPSDRNNWNGFQVPHQQIEEMARYSKEIWPNLTTIIRAWPEYLQGHSYPSLDATWIQYHARFGDMERFIDTRLHEAQKLGLSVVAGLNVVNGGGLDSGMPSYEGPKNAAMNASQVRTWGERLLQEDVCLFLLWNYRPDYFTRQEIQEAAEYLSGIARNRPRRSCDK